MASLRRAVVSFVLTVVASSSIPAARADALADLRGALDKLHGDQPLRAQIAVREIQTSNEDGAGRQVVKEGTFSAALDAAGLDLGFSIQQLRDDREAARRQAAAPDAAVRKGGTLDLLDARQAAELLDHAEVLRLDLEGASLVEDKVEPKNGKPTRVLVLTPRDGLSTSDRKALKSRDDTLKVWLGPDGLPIAAERVARYKFSKFLISFEVKTHEVRTFARQGGRLVVASATEESGGAGLGQSGETKRIVRVTFPGG